MNPPSRIALLASAFAAAVVPPVLAVIAVAAARMPHDELAHPLDVPPAATMEP